MNGTIKVLCYKSKTLRNGEHPLMLCVCKDNKRKFQQIIQRRHINFDHFERYKAIIDKRL